MKVSGSYLQSALKKFFSERLSLTEDKADDSQIDHDLRVGAQMRGTNLWLLIFAIFIASIGLNVNSTAVIIGAMLISPLMGPIMGIGYGIGIYDFELIRRSLRHLAYAVGIALLTSTIYFLFSPLTQAESELLARTSPTLWDVLIALFGGFAGIVGATRKEKSNVIPGVAIATALMPPLCTAGYGLANGNWSFFFGAIYLFAINCVFIAFAAIVIIRAFGVRRYEFVNMDIQKRMQRLIAAIVLVTILPSGYLAYVLVQDEIFKAHASKFISDEFNFPDTHVAESSIKPKEKSIEVTLIGKYISTAELATIADRLGKAGLGNARLKTHQAADQQHVDVTSLKSGVLSDLYTQSQVSLEKKDLKIQTLEKQLEAQQHSRDEIKGVPAELHALFPQISKVWLSDALSWEVKAGLEKDNTLLLNLFASAPLSEAERLTIKRWVEARLKTSRVKLLIDYEAKPVASKAKTRKSKRRKSGK